MYSGALIVYKKELNTLTIIAFKFILYFTKLKRGQFFLLIAGVSDEI
jgi:hypothetical protein